MKSKENIQAGRILTPTMKQSELIAYFANKLPADLPKKLYAKGLGCYGMGRLIVRELGGPGVARLYQVVFEYQDEEPYTSHGYVVPLAMGPDELAYNNYSTPVLTIGQVLENGTDVTDEVLDEPWSTL